MRKPRGYGESCPIAHSLDLIGDRWALMIVRELRLGPRRFADLQAALPAIGPTTLSQRLRDLTEVGVLERGGQPARMAEYALTAWGADLEPVFGALARWGAASPVVGLRGPVSDDAVMLGLRTFVSDAIPLHQPPKQQARIEVRLARERYRMELASGRLTGLRRTTADSSGSAEPVDVTLDTDSATIQAMLTGRSSATAAADQVRISGDRRLGRWLLGFLTPRGRRAADGAPSPRPVPDDA